MSTRAWSVAAAGTVLLLVATGCGAAETTVARDTAVEFERALAGGDARRACDLLAPRTRSELVESAGKPCPEALVEESLPRPGTVRGADVFGTMAQVRFAADVLFLAEFRDGWKVMAAGCEDRPDQPYDCTVGD